MKKISAFILPMSLLACDKISQSPEIRFKACCDAEKYGTMIFKMSGDKATLKVDDNYIDMTKTDSYKTGVIFNMNWQGTVPETDVRLGVSLNYNPETKELALYNFTVNNVGYGLDVVTLADLPGYTPSTQSEKCIAEINSLVSFHNETVFMYDTYKMCENRIEGTKFSCHDRRYQVPIDTANAIKITADWAPEKLTAKEGYGTNPCATLENLKTYISEHKSDSEIVMYKEDEQCISGTKDIYFGCDYDNRYDYYKLSLCDNNIHTLSEIYTWNNRFEHNTEFIVASTTEKGTLYSEKFPSAIDAHNILYGTDSNIYVKYKYSDEPYVACEIIELTPHQLCARNLSKETKYNPESGTIDIDIPIKHRLKTISLSAEQALSITPNWDYANGIKMYKEGNADYEHDACVAQRRLHDLINVIKTELQE